ncbi:carboxymuconolactone decarboxylase family protein [Arcobacter peruensis]|uniref:carboxymuconolactone decarboxylase family protein n=1 Tax=Arcobacter peruensis TaxID=2320140 RepID=UPI000F086CE0|nr:carboxymuconolactone decarboxylase family protein [Arcobacter peruensis]
MTGEDLKAVKALKEISEDSSLSKREKHLVGLAVTLTLGCTVCSTRRFTEALEDDISKKELIDLSDFVAMTSAGVISRTALSSWDDNNDEICTDGTCSVS